MITVARRPGVVERINYASVWLSGLVAAILATVVNGAGYFALSRFADVSFDVIPIGQEDVQELSAAMIAGVSFGVVIIATAGLWFLSLLRKAGLTIWALIVQLGYLASLVGPITAAQDAGTMWSLIGAHTVVAAAAIFGPGKAARRA